MFQRTIGQRTEVITPESLRAELAKLSDALSVEHPELAACRFTPHDFRRLFATDLVNHGLTIHIGAALLGHLDVQTTHGYVSVSQGRHPALPGTCQTQSRPSCQGVPGGQGHGMNGPNSKSISTSERSSSAAASAPTPPPASTNMPVSVAPCSKSTLS
ncbi:tyrosine-type recombinase/integrase [Arthrobacter sp. SAFR-023]|uniref:site-specific integrase n=1 Tax=Arthrobacter sp. SAFR-023 TaxID=3436866 RepID=UPI003F7C13C8|nr:site-specific integrase [Arthrobacter sp. FW305-BF8]